MSVVMPAYDAAGKPAGSNELYAGAVLTTREVNGYDDSDFYAVAWDDEQGKLVRYEYATTRYGGGGYASADATPDATAKANAWAYKTLKKQMFSQYVEGLKVPEKGDFVKVVKGKEKGKAGKLFWVGEKRTYGGYSKWSQNTVQKVGVALDDEKNEKGQFKNVCWTYLANLEADVSKKFKLAEAKRRLRYLKQNGWGAWVCYQAYPLMYVQ